MGPWFHIRWHTISRTGPLPTLSLSELRSGGEEENRLVFGTAGVGAAGRKIGRSRVIHNLPSVTARDVLRDEWLTGRGCRVMRFANDEPVDDILPMIFARLSADTP